MDDTQIQVQVPPTLATPDEAQIVIVHKGSIADTVNVDRDATQNVPLKLTDR